MLGHGEREFNLQDGIQVANQLTLSRDIIFDNLSRLRVILGVFQSGEGGCRQG